MSTISANVKALDGVSVVNGTPQESSAIRVTQGIADTIQWTITQTGTPDVDFDYAISEDGETFTSYIPCFGAAGNSSAGEFTNSSGSLNGATVALEPAKFYKLRATNNDGVNTATVTLSLRYVEETT